MTPYALHQFGTALVAVIATVQLIVISIICWSVSKRQVDNFWRRWVGNRKYVDVMIDTETWGLDTTAQLRSIGAVVFDLKTGVVSDTKRFYVAITPQPSHQHLFDRQSSTIEWWSQQSDEAKAAFKNPVFTYDAVQMLIEWFAGLNVAPENIRIWAHGPVFDIPKLEYTIRVMKASTPWHYRSPRDTRTLFDMAGIVDHSDWLNKHPGPLNIPHHALDDAICQAYAVCAAYKRL